MHKKTFTIKKIISVFYIFTPALISFLSLPQIASAEVTDFRGLTDLIQSMLEMVVPIIIGTAVLFFLYGIFKSMTATGEDAKSEGRTLMLYGIVALFVMVSVWGLVRLLTDTFGWGLVIPSISQ
ncbi:MAG: hypothetical protein WCW87_01575 [Candidatus Paceibacterota bacterium]